MSDASDDRTYSDSVMSTTRRAVATVSGFVMLAAMATTLLPGGASAADPVTVWAVGDICDDDNEAIDCADVGDLVAAGSPDYFVPLGDIQYEKGALTAFNKYYDPKVGAKLNSVTKPVVGNHEYRITNAADYFSYFGSSAGDPTKGYYSWTVGNWRLVVLNSNCAKIGGICGYPKAEGLWLRDQLAGPETCEVIFAHHPPITDGEYAPGISSMKGFWRRAYEARAELFVVRTRSRISAVRTTSHRHDPGCRRSAGARGRHGRQVALPVLGHRPERVPPGD